MPYAIRLGAMSTNPDGNGVILVGGQKPGNIDLDSILELKTDGQGWVGAWTILTTKLQFARRAHIMIPISMDLCGITTATTTTAPTTTTATTTTINPLFGPNATATKTTNQRYFVAAGYPSASGVKSEIVDLLDPSKSCLLEDITPHRWIARGGLLGTTPVICGGWVAIGSGNSLSDECILYGTTQVVNMNSINNYHVSVGLNSSMIWILGGHRNGSDVLDTTEFITVNGAVNGPTLPEKLTYSCGVKFPDNGKVYMIGGHTVTSYVKNVWVADPLDGYTSFTQGPSLSENKCNLHCGTMSVGAKSIIVAAGGHNAENFLESVEILDPLSNQWVHGKYILLHPMYL